jgi:nucleoside phosphorylase
MSVIANDYADVLLVTATEIESRALVDVFERETHQQAQPTEIDDRIYFSLGAINGARIAMMQSEMGSIGLDASLQTVRKGIDALSPVAVIMVGIAFGMDDQKQHIGEILVATQLLLYEMQRVGTENGDPQIIPRGGNPAVSPKLLNRMRSANLSWKGAKGAIWHPPVRRNTGRQF